MYTAALLCVLFGVCFATPLNLFVSHYEPLNYDQHNLIWNHNRVRRSNVGPKEIELRIDAFGSFFNLILYPDNNLFDEDTELEGGGQPFPKHHILSVMYSGHDIDDETITAHGHVAFGVFDGIIRTEYEIYYVEPASRYHTNSSGYHSVIYRHSDLNTTAVNLASCGGGDGSLAESFQKSSARGEKQHRLPLATSSPPGADPSRPEMKRQAATPSSNTRCRLRVLGDYDFYSAVTSGSSAQERMTQAMAILATIIKEASNIYQSTSFTPTSGGNIAGINFAISKLLVDPDPPTGPPFNNAFIGVQAFLDYHSQSDYSQYCLSYRFTYRQFDQGVIGLAYVAAAGSLGGICEKATVSNGVTKTLNTGIVTLLNYGQRVPLMVNILTFAHEAGHNFGSTHDSDTDTVCAPPEGKYIMYAHATDGSQPNNKQFSPCSRKLMGDIIKLKQDVCFVRGDSNCGNALIDAGEDCDCVDADYTNKKCLSDPCCNVTSCKLNIGVQCSPQSSDQQGQGGVCCNASTCSFITESARVMCSNETECAYSQNCSGNSSVCPTPTPKIFSTPKRCGSNGAYCKNGVCDGTVCNVVLRVSDCECTTADKACHLCCNFGGTCVSSFNFDTSLLTSNNITINITNNIANITRQIGLPCANFTGHCDFLNKCQLVNSDGALKLVFSTITSNLGNILVQIKKYWWAVLLAGVGVLVAMFLLVLACHFLLPRPQKARRKAQQRIDRKRQKGASSNETELHNRRR